MHIIAGDFKTLFCLI